MKYIYFPKLCLQMLYFNYLEFKHLSIYLSHLSSKCTQCDFLDLQEKIKRCGLTDVAQQIVARPQSDHVVIGILYPFAN